MEISDPGLAGQCWDNALAESTIGQLKAELVHRRGPWRTIEQLEFALFEYLDWWNQRRLHGEIGMIPPVEKEATYYRQTRSLETAGSQLNRVPTEQTTCPPWRQWASRPTDVCSTSNVSAPTPPSVIGPCGPWRPGDHRQPARRRSPVRLRPHPGPAHRPGRVPTTAPRVPQQRSAGASRAPAGPRPQPHDPRQNELRPAAAAPARPDRADPRHPTATPSPSTDCDCRSFSLGSTTRLVRPGLADLLAETRTRHCAGILTGSTPRSTTYPRTTS